MLQTNNKKKGMTLMMMSNRMIKMRMINKMMRINKSKKKATLTNSLSSHKRKGTKTTITTTIRNNLNNLNNK